MDFLFYLYYTLFLICFICCRRCRRVQPGRSSYELQLDTLSNVDSSSVTAELINADNGVRFQMLLAVLKDNTFRLQIDEVVPLRPRYRDIYSLEKDPEKVDRYVI